ncbi:hypothetical protein FSARC_3531 [Fusarium sarcochroum]|uniref:Single-strand DNA deaminase toxin A-like C-terminal domain-containing protein n=1 Tax=Fusarium sarcochroum TaxID=1208366 RepID=A0A8H4U3K8_9HYPO|nr:hypothetical protein FSARC_3531 [Fusarium sarcochroum]
MDYSYEIDKKGCRFRTVGVTTAEEDEEDEVNSEGGTVTFSEDGDDVARLQHDVSRLAVDSLNKPHEQESSEEILEELYSDPSWRLDKFFSYCINNDICGVRRLISAFGDPFTESQDENGDNCVSFAAVEGHASMICFLHENGGNLNNVNMEGKTPLMEASLWGRLDVMEFLLANGANASLQDRKGRKALFYAQPSGATTRMSQRHGHYSETSQAESNRRVIALRLQSYEPVGARQQLNNSGRSKSGRFIVERNPRQNQITYFEHNTTYDIPDEYKTIARLDRGRLFPIISAASGWRIDFAVEDIIDNYLWTCRVRELCKLINYDLPPDQRDRSEPPGTFFASHAEKKLIAYYIDRHMVLPCAMIEDIKQEERGEWIGEHFALQDLAEVQPEFPTIKARICVSRGICENCEQFVNQVEAKLGVSFRIETCGEGR